MAARKRNGGRETDAARAFTVVVEEMRGHFRVFGERIEALDQTMTSGFARVDERLADVSLELGRLKTAVLEHGRQLRGVVRRDEVEGIVEGVMARKRG